MNITIKLDVKIRLCKIVFSFISKHFPNLSREPNSHIASTTKLEIRIQKRDRKRKPQRENQTRKAFSFGVYTLMVREREVKKKRHGLQKTKKRTIRIRSSIRRRRQPTMLSTIAILIALSLSPPRRIEIGLGFARSSL